MFTPSIQRQRGLTLIELMVAVALASLVTIAAVSALIIARQGFTSVDTASQLRDNGRFASSLIRRVILQGGYVSTQYAMDRSHMFKVSTTIPEPYIKGFNNARYNQNLASGVTNTVATSGTGINNSDMLVVRYQTGQTITDGAADEAMIACNGETATAPINATDRMLSVFHIANSAQTGEPSLMCTWVNNSGTWSTQPLIEGVESMQILYGTYGVIPNTAPAALSSTTLTPPPERYLRADQLVVNGDDTATIGNWARVRSIRIGLVLRGPTGSSPEKAVPAQYPFGKTKKAGDSASTPDSAMASANDAGSTLAAQNDGRLRQSLTFTVHLRNPQDAI